MGDINVTQKTQKIIVDPSTSSVSIINAGPAGPSGTPAVNGIPAGGTTGQVLAKLSNNDYDVGWVTP